MLYGNVFNPQNPSSTRFTEKSKQNRYKYEQKHQQPAALSLTYALIELYN